MPWSGKQIRFRSTQEVYNKMEATKYYPNLLEYMVFKHNVQWENADEQKIKLVLMDPEKLY